MGLLGIHTGTLKKGYGNEITLIFFFINRLKQNLCLQYKIYLKYINNLI